MIRTTEDIRIDISITEGRLADAREDRNFLKACEINAELDKLYDELETTDWTPESKHSDAVTRALHMED